MAFNLVNSALLRAESCVLNSSRGMARLKYPGMRRNSLDFVHYVREKRHHNRFAFMIKPTRSKRYPGHIDVFDKEGEREPLQAAVDRYKRLDFGTYVRTWTGKSNRKYKKTEAELWQAEQHMFAWKEFVPKLEKMFTHDIKRKRYFPDDPWEKYNNMSFIKHKYTLLKNAENVRQLGNMVYKFDRYKAHLDRVTPYNKLQKEHYMPPGFLKNVADNNGVFVPDNENETPEPEQIVPHFQRKPIKQPDFVVSRRNFRKTGFYIDNDYQQKRTNEMFTQPLKPWSTVMHRRKY